MFTLGLKDKRWENIVYKDVCMDMYSISTYGKVKNNYTERILKYQVNKKGYCEMYLRTETGKRFVSIHRLVAIHFVYNDDPTNKNEVNHKTVMNINGKKFKSNYYKNLEWVTHQGNVTHAIDTGITYHLYGAENPVTKYKVEYVRLICEKLEEGKSIPVIYEEITEVFSELIEYRSKHIKALIRKIRDKHTWVHISNEYNF